MTDPTNPTEVPHVEDLPGIHEFKVSIPFTRTVAGEQHTMHIVVRIPAATISASYELAEPLGRHIAEHHTGEGGRWEPNFQQMTSECVDEIPAPDYVAAELAHWRRVVAALATKMPGLLQLTPDEYGAADPDDIIASRMGDAMVFLGSAAFAPPRAELFPTDPEPAGPQTPGVEPELASYTGPTPPNPGGLTDPDVRTAAAPTLARAKKGEVEIVLDGRWRRLAAAVIDHENGTVRIDCEGPWSQEVPHHHLFVARPATTEGYASDLPTAALVAQQTLTAQGWMTVEHAESLGPFSGNTYKASLIGDNGAYQTSFNTADQLLLRNTRPGWWS